MVHCGELTRCTFQEICISCCAQSGVREAAKGVDFILTKYMGGLEPAVILK